MPCGQAGGLERVAAASMAARYAARLGLSKRACGEVAICVAELVSNVNRHAVGGAGEIALRVVSDPRPALEIAVSDRGPGMADPELAFRDGWSRGAFLGPDSRPRDGLGLGLGAVRRLMDEARIESALGSGTTVVARKWL
jgi:serine/threonine-protein kinase RsbT